MSKAVDFLKKTLGEDLLEEMQKTELYKPDTRSVTSLEDIHLGMKLVPRTIMALLVRELVPMAIDEQKTVVLPVPGPNSMEVKKLSHDVYSGQIFQDNKKVAEFSHRPIPGVGLVIMSTFELYDHDEGVAKPVVAFDETRLQKLIEERLALHDLVSRVVDQRMERKDAIQHLMLARLTSAMQTPPSPAAAPVIVVTEPSKKNLPLKDFLDKRKLKKNEFFITLEKSETFRCGDCGKEIFSESGYSGCICYGENMNSKVHLKKTEGGFKISFGRGWDQENLEMLLEVLRSKRG